ncbi:Oidioi.mRNA.OKI2018_I69.PAR.g10140.t1.cds [Oikopleura dioica]|uniref:Oidioi.mRNA.OKI2018_I69.PAR.g10140.t1.cds n=1 Tax=Oikopleura dioica TaxID=34765 RepID=A0ABN7RP11_OIKDI|nr:Oidioi.mRNA.OKI2018_I69.PAR.g10140.t1.cds [Oikopleura dioica]
MNRIVIFLYFLISIARGEAVLDLKSFNEKKLQEYEVVLVNFYADWCRFSRQLHPIFEQTATVLEETYPAESKKVLLARVDCEDQQDLAQKFHISKYPTIKIFHNGRILKREYRGNRSPAEFKKFIDNMLVDPVIQFTSLEHAKQLEDQRQKGMLIGYFEKEDSETYKVFAKVANVLQDDCEAIVGFGNVSYPERHTGENIVFKDVENGNAPVSEDVFLNAMRNYQLLFDWAHDKCVPVVREITFLNGEELTEEGLPFLILFHKKEDTKSLKEYSNTISRTLIGQRSNINFLHADCDQFSHPLHHLGKSPADCPLIAIDSFKHMYLYPDYTEAHKDQKLLQFVKDLNSGKLHREFHNGPDPTEKPDEDATEATIALEKESVFKKLKPSKHRHSFPKGEHDEL